MIAIAVVDERNGMLFHQRRQSQDALLREHILHMIGSGRLWMNEYSYCQFAQNPAEVSPAILVAEAFLSKAAADDFCFIEDQLLQPFLTQIQKLILFKWNRAYPGDFYLDISCKEPDWKLEETLDFSGSSHERITREVYRHEI